MKCLMAGDRAARNQAVKVMKDMLTRNAVGRIALHLGCICRGGTVSHHWQGILRELRECSALLWPFRQRQEPVAPCSAGAGGRRRGGSR